MFDEFWLKAGLIISRAELGHEAALVHDAEPEHPRIPIGRTAFPIKLVTLD